MAGDGVKAAKEAGTLQSKIAVAIDSDLKECYGNAKGEGVARRDDPNTVPVTVRSRPKNGQTACQPHAMQGIGPQAKILLGAKHYGQGRAQTVT